MNKVKKNLITVARYMLNIISYILFAPAYFLARFCEWVDPILDDIEDKMGF